jgi:AcrR family transcriptional regulator
MSDPRRERSRNALLQATLALLDERSFEAISTADIADRAGVSRATLFRIFSSKEILLEGLARGQIEALIAFTLPIYDTADKEAAFEGLCDYVDAHRSLWTTLLTGGAADAMRNELLRESRKSATIRSSIGDWLPIDLAVSCTTSAIILGLKWWLGEPSGLISKKQAATILYRLVIEPSPPR